MRKSWPDMTWCDCLCCLSRVMIWDRNCGPGKPQRIQPRASTVSKQLRQEMEDQIRPDDQIDFDTESAPAELLGALTLCRLLVFNGILPRCTWQFLPASPCLLPLCLFEDTEYWLPSYFDETFYLEIAQGSWNIVKSLKSKIPLSRFEKLLTRNSEVSTSHSIPDIFGKDMWVILIVFFNSQMKKTQKSCPM